MQTTRCLMEVLSPSHLEELADALLCPEVFRFIEPELPSRECFRHGLMLAVAGPSAAQSHQQWLHYLVRCRSDHSVLGRLEATLHDGLAELAFLLAPSCWGQGYGLECLHWLETEVFRQGGRLDLFATTAPGNLRCQALLERAGYQRLREPAALQTDAWPALMSYEPGDLVYRRPGPT